MKRLFYTTGQLIAILLLILCCSNQAQAQVTAAGDLVFTGIGSRGSAGTDSFSFVLLKAVAAGNTVNFTDRGWNGTSWNAAGTSESSITWTVGTGGLTIGTEVLIVGTTATTSSGVNGTVTSTASPAVGLDLRASDQVIAYIGDLAGSYTVIAGAHWNTCSGAATDATWDVSGSCTVTGIGTSVMPPGLNPSNGAFYLGRTSSVQNVAGRFNCVTAGAPFISTDTARAAILKRANWDLTTNAGVPTAPTGCTYIGAPAPDIDTQPTGSTVCAGTNSTSFTVAASGTGTLTYQWQVSTTGTGGTYTNVSGINYSNATTATLTVTNAPASFNGYAYRANVTNSGGTTASNGAVLTVANGVPSFSVQPTDAAICPGGSTTLSGTATGSTSYQWQVNNGSGFTNITNGGIYSNATTSNLTITGAPNTMYGYLYRLNATNACGTTGSSAVPLTFRSSWTGTTSTNWNIAGNWSCNLVPDTLTDVVIGTATNQPTVSTVANVRNVTLNTGGTLTIAAANTLAVAGAITNAGGTLNATATNATINFNSIRPNQPVAGGTYYSVQFNGTGNKVLAGDVTVNGSANILTNQLVLLGNNTLTIGATGSVSANASRYFVTNGTGGLKKMGITSTSFVYPVGTTTSYTPFLVNNSGGTSDNFTGRVIDGVYANYVNDVPQGSAITSKVVNKSWFVTEDVPGGSNVQMIVQWNQSDELSGFVRTSLIFSHYYGGKWNPMPLQGASPSTGAGPYTATRTGITTFSPFGIGNIQTALPLKLLTFTGNKQNEGVALNWETADEKNITGFNIERSADGRNFEAIGLVAAQNAATDNSYSFLDKTAPAVPSSLYYRLKMNEQDGNFNYSNTVTVAQDKKGNAGFEVSPNPANGAEIYIQSNGRKEGNLEISITDMAGKNWYHQTATLSGERVPVNIQAMPAGVYMLRLQQGSSVQSIKIVRH